MSRKNNNFSNRDRNASKVSPPRKRTTRKANNKNFPNTTQKSIRATKNKDSVLKAKLLGRSESKVTAKKEDDFVDHKQQFMAPSGLKEGEEYRTPVVTLTIDIDNVGRRIDNFMISIVPNIPKSNWYKLFRKGEIRVNKGRVKADYKLALGDQVRIAPLKLINRNELSLELEDIVQLNSVQQLKNSIIYEDKYLLVINKPSGIAVHGGSGVDFGVIEALRVLLPTEKRLELVHRIDKDTSGLLLLSKRPRILKDLQEQFRKKTISKTYLCMVIGRWSASTVNKPLLRYEKLGERFVKVDDTGKPSITNFTTLSYYRDSNDRVFSLVEAKPLTGRTHQIRVHTLDTLNALLGDSKYALNSDLEYVKKQGLNRLFLHAYRLEFVHPVTEEVIQLKAPLPKELENFVNSLQEIEG